jgi:CHAD domain-containing protein
MNLQPALQQRLKRFRKRLRRLQADVTAANIHDFRIACREVLACYPLLKSITPAQHWKPFLKNALDALNRLRDLQQLQAQLLQQQLLRPSLVHSTIDMSIEKATQRWLRYAPTLQSSEFLKALAATEQSLVTGDSLSETLQATFEKQWKKALHRTHESLMAADTADLKSLHRLRIRYKKLRYLLELLENDISLSSQKETIKQWQDMLGDVQDFRVMASLAKKLELPPTLYEEFLTRADELAQHCIAQRATLAQFLIHVDDQVRALL